MTSGTYHLTRGAGYPCRKRVETHPPPTSHPLDEAVLDQVALARQVGRLSLVRPKRWSRRRSAASAGGRCDAALNTMARKAQGEASFRYGFSASEIAELTEQSLRVRGGRTATSPRTARAARFAPPGLLATLA